MRLDDVLSEFVSGGPGSSGHEALRALERAVVERIQADAAILEAAYRARAAGMSWLAIGEILELARPGGPDEQTARVEELPGPEERPRRGA